jgi:molybdopterin/thiamine biosynthesis adenylyltransferase
MQDGRLHLDVALAGCGAIGTAIALILQELDAEGEILLIDRQRFARENVATYSLGDEGNAHGRPWKVNLVARHLTRYRVRRFQGDVETLPQQVDDGAVRWPRAILGALDSPEARRALQLLWPDRLIDGGTSDTAVALHDVRAESGPCLKCFFPEPVDDETVHRLAEITSLTPDFLGQGDTEIREEHIAHLPTGKRELMLPYIGKKVCGLAQAFGLVTSDPAGYAPAVPFVSQQAACLVIGRLIADAVGLKGLPNFVEYDALLGPTADVGDQRQADRDCYSEREHERIARVRQHRRGLTMRRGRTPAAGKRRVAKPDQRAG